MKEYIKPEAEKRSLSGNTVMTTTSLPIGTTTVNGSDALSKHKGFGEVWDTEDVEQ